jgi:hypothetical protein
MWYWQSNAFYIVLAAVLLNSHLFCMEGCVRNRYMFVMCLVVRLCYELGRIVNESSSSELGLIQN